MNEENISLNKLSPTKSPVKEDKGDAGELGEALNTDGEDYDPHLHRNRPHPTTNFETLVHLLKGALGTGILAMPQAFHNSGWLSGFISTFFLGFLCTYCLHVLVNSTYTLCKRHKIPMLTYPEAMKTALESGPQCLRPFAGASPIIVDIFLISYQLGICCVYIMFTAVNIKQVVDAYTDTPISLTVYFFIIFIPLVLINCIRNLKILAPFSTFANVLTFIGIAITLYYIFDNLPGVEERHEFGSARNYALFFGTVLFALEAVGVVIAVENNMKTPKSFGGYFGVLNIAMVVVTTLYAFVGVFGYIKYGDDAEGSVTLNLPAEAKLAQSVKAMFAIAIYISYGLQCYVPIEIVWSTYMDKKIQNNRMLWEYALRIGAVIVTFALAVTIPRLGLFISLFGCLCLSALGLAFPAIIELCVQWPDKLGPFKYILIKDIILIIFGIIGLVVGTYTALVDIVRSFD